MRTRTLCIHAGHRAHSESPSVVAPIVHSSTFLLDDAAYEQMLTGRVEEALIYTRLGNPTLDVVQERMAALEGAEHALVFSSGMAAIHAAVMSSLSAGARIVAHSELYGSTWDLFHNFLSRFSVETEFVDLGDRAARTQALARGARIVYCESISNPTLGVSDVAGIARDAHAAGAKLIVDATFATPVLQRPIELGADMVVHSATKYLGGHSDLIGGVVAGSRALLAPVYRWLQLAGGCMDPRTASLLDRGIKTLPLRMRAHCDGARAIAEWLTRDPRVSLVLYPGLATHRSHSLAVEQLAGGGGMVSFVHAGGDAQALAFVRALKLALEATSLGGVETLVSLPFNTSHVKLSPSERTKAGIPPGFVRVSVGIEDPEDLIADFFAQALDAASRAR